MALIWVYETFLEFYVFFFYNKKSLLVLLRNVHASIILYLLLIDSSKFGKKHNVLIYLGVVVSTDCMLGNGIGGDIGGDIG